VTVRVCRGLEVRARWNKAGSQHRSVNAISEKNGRNSEDKGRAREIGHMKTRMQAGKGGAAGEKKGRDGEGGRCGARKKVLTRTGLRGRVTLAGNIDGC